MEPRLDRRGCGSRSGGAGACAVCWHHQPSRRRTPPAAARSSCSSTMCFCRCRRSPRAWSKHSRTRSTGTTDRESRGCRSCPVRRRALSRGTSQPCALLPDVRSAARRGRDGRGRRSGAPSLDWAAVLRVLGVKLLPASWVDPLDRHARRRSDRLADPRAARALWRRSSAPAWRRAAR